MKKETFISAIEALQKQIEYDEIVAQKLSDIYKSEVEFYDNHWVSNALIGVLQEDFSDIDFIEMFCFELDFGKNYRHGSIKNEDGSNIDLSDAGKLYDFLITNI